jgi:hypothetical protein
MQTPPGETPAAGTLATPAVEAASLPAERPAGGMEAACPDEVEGTSLYVSSENGLCFLYPSDLHLRPDTRYPNEVIQLLGPPLDPSAMESIALNLSVAYNGPADGLDSAQYAATWLERNAAGLDVLQTSATIGGQPAVVADNLPGFGNQRGAFVVANGAKYQLTLMPQPQDVPELAESATRAWDMVMRSLVFFPAQRTDTVVRAADVCPATAADTKLLIDEVGGYCLLYPADFDLDPNLPGAIAGGSELGPFGDFPSLRASLTIGGAYPLADMAPEQVLQPSMENNDPNSVVSTTIAGYPAVIYDFVTGPWRQRNAAVVVEDRYYTFVIQPWDLDLFPQALPDVERLWQTVSESIAFFDPWR